MAHNSPCRTDGAADHRGSLTLEATTALQHRASAPLSCAWVSANAGAGKTHVLVQRVIRLLLNGVAPEKILSITYTRAAAAEMSSRIIRTLSDWAVVDDAALEKALAGTLGRAPTPNELEISRTLFLKAIETPGGLKVQTIHAFCEKLLQRFPLEAGVVPQFSVIETAEQNQLLAAATDMVLLGADEPDDTDNATGGDQTALTAFGQTLATSLARVADHRIDDSFQSLISAMIAQRQLWQPAVDRALAGPTELAALYAASLNVPDLDVRATRSKIANALTDKGGDWLAHLEAIARGGGKNDVKLADAVLALMTGSATLDEDQRLATVQGIFLTVAGSPRAKLLNKAITDQHPVLVDELSALQAEVARLSEREATQRLAQASIALVHVSQSVAEHYARLKEAKSVLDYTDLITATRKLVAAAGDAQWVLFKLDESLEHVLVDEAQDTGEQQWEIIGALVEEYFAGRSGDQPVRTIFAVGDEKQSIYSFQGAKPELFQAFRTRFTDLAANGGIGFADTRLQLSFRSAPLILQLVDAVFAERDIGFGAGNEPGTGVTHAAKRATQGGIIELWPPLQPSPKPRQNGLLPLDENAQPDVSPELTIARGVARTIAMWIATQRPLSNADRPVRPGDIMILLANRGALARALVRELKSVGVPVAGADRLRLKDQLAVQDLLSVCRFVLLPEDDLALAELLKSPLFDFSDDDLLALRFAMGSGNPRIGPGARGIYWRNLLAAEQMVATHGGFHSVPSTDTYAGARTALTMTHVQARRMAQAARQLRVWRDRADFSPPFEFLHQLLGENGNLQRQMRRLGPEAADAIDELLALAMSFDDANVPSLQGFLTYIEDADPEIKREMAGGRDEVRIMTIHGAKGLEAPIVILPDTARPTGENNQVPKIDYLATPTDDQDAIRLPIWQLSPWNSTAPQAKTAESARKRRAEEEKLRLLYVALTRAEDELYIGGFANTRSASQQTWYEIIADALTHEGFTASTRPPAQLCETAQIWTQVFAAAVGETTSADTPEQQADHVSASVLRFQNDGTADKEEKAAAPALDPVELPPWLDEQPAAERPYLLPVSPSILVPLDHADAQLAFERISPENEADQASPGFAARRGDVMHALLQTLPELPVADWRQVCDAIFAQELPGATPEQVARATHEVTSLLTLPELAEIFGPNARAEVAIVQTLRPDPHGQPIVINGQIDRLHVTDTVVTVADFKTGRPPKDVSEQPPDAYLVQLAAYASAVRGLYPGRHARQVLIWSRGPMVQWLTPEWQTAGEKRLFQTARQRVKV